MRRFHFAKFLLGSLLVGGCGGAPEVNDAWVVRSIEAGSPEAAAVLAVVNDPAVTFEVLDIAAELDRRAARNIVDHRDGPDGRSGTSDDDRFDDLEELDAVPYVGDAALQLLLRYAEANGYVGGSGSDVDADSRAILALVNAPHLTFELLDDDVGLDRRAADSIFSFRVGSDGNIGTSDDRFFNDLESLDALPYVGESALARLLEYALANGYGSGTPGKVADVIFSPQPYVQSHNVRIVSMIQSARSSIDIAMYSFSDQRILDALEAAVARGVVVRFVFETANEDRSKTGNELESSWSAQLERIGINVRYVNKIMHHKFIIVDGPKHDPDAADTAQIASGSANWSYGAATRYDENTVFLTGYSEIAFELQAEFNLMWAHSRDFVYDGSLPYELSTLPISAGSYTDDPNVEVHVTSDNFSVSGTTFRIISGHDTVSVALVDAINRAQSSIRIASGHLRSRPIAEALIAKKAAQPNIDIRIYLDGQEYISAGYHNQQVRERDDCLTAAGTSASAIRLCNDRGFYYGYQAHLAGIDVRYKYYSYRWHYSYAVQMHHKLMIIDDRELWTGSYNYSDNAEHNTFENMMGFRGAELAPLIARFSSNFEALWSTARDDNTYANLVDRVETASVIPLVFDPMALDWNEITALKATIRANCSLIDTEPYRTAPESHRTCPRR